MFLCRMSNNSRMIKKVNSFLLFKLEELLVISHTLMRNSFSGGICQSQKKLSRIICRVEDFKLEFWTLQITNEMCYEVSDIDTYALGRDSKYWRYVQWTRESQMMQMGRSSQWGASWKSHLPHCWPPQLSLVAVLLCSSIASHFLHPYFYEEEKKKKTAKFIRNRA